MKGDINLKINKKIGLAILASVGFFAMADFVSMIDVKSSGGISIDKELSDSDLEQIMPVGSVALRMDNINPSAIYGGTWQLITGDAALGFGNGSAQSGLSIGDNTPAVPLLEHDHSINHDHPTATTSSDTHSHQITIWNGTGTGGAKPSGYAIRSSSGGYTTTSDTHNHTINLPNFSGNSGKAGTSNATLDVRGERILVNVWKRIS